MDLTGRSFSFGALVLGSVCAAPVAGEFLLTLEDAVRLGLEKNFSISRAHDAAEIATNDRSYSRGAFLPEVSAGVNYGREPGADAAGASAGVTADWLVFDGFRSYHVYGRLQARERAAQLAHKAEMERVVEEITSAYFGIVSEKQVREALMELLEVSEQRAKMAQARLELGSGSRLEQLQTLADLNADSSALIDQAVRLHEAKVRLNTLLARKAETPYDVTDTIPLNPALKVDSLQASLPKRNTLLLLAVEDRAAAEKALKESRSLWFPRVNAQVSYFGAPEEWRPEGAAAREGLGFGVSASVPLFNRLQTLRQTGNARLELRRSETGLAATEQAVTAEFSSLAERHAAGLARVRLEERNLEVARLQAAAAEERYRVGTANYLEFRDAQRRQLDARSRFIAARYQTKLAETALVRLGGELVSER